MPDSRDQTRAGLGYALLAYGLWGALPVYWKLLTHVPAAEQLLHRVLWSAAILLVLVRLRGRWPLLIDALHERRKRRLLIGSAVVLSINWFVFLYAIETDRVLHSSLGYYLNPIVSVVLGMVALGERLRRLQWAAVACASVGVASLFVRAGELPWISLVLAAAFGSYGLLRKLAEVETLPGNTIEAVLPAIPCVLALVWLELHGSGQFVRSGPLTTALLLASGPVTALPLLAFTAAARRLPLFALGFMQYLTPTAHLLLAVLVFDEPFGAAQATAFTAIWLGVGLFALDLGLQSRRASA
jgi:chloramphenicol-sensitive protein RarD